MRLRRLCSDQDDFVAKSLEMAEFFRDRGYPEKTVELAREKCCAIPCSETLIPKNRDDSVKIPLLLSYHQSSVKVAGIIHKNDRILADDVEFGHHFE